MPAKKTNETATTTQVSVLTPEEKNIMMSEEVTS
jgi:hypothetical protein